MEVAERSRADTSETQFSNHANPTPHATIKIEYEQLDVVKQEIAYVKGEPANAFETFRIKIEYDTRNCNIPNAPIAETPHVARPEPRNDREPSKKSHHIHKNVLHVCEVCAAKFPSFRTLAVHMSRRHGGAKAADRRCGKCELKFKWPNGLRRHAVRTHLGPRTRKLTYCPHCYKTFNTTELLEAHIERMHVTVAPGTAYCKECRSTFRSEDRLQRHAQLRHPRAYRSGRTPSGRHFNRVRCKLCQRRFNHPYYFKEHYEKAHLTRGAARKFACYMCTCVYRHRQALLRHIQLGHYRYKCKICDRPFKLLRSLNGHRARKHAVKIFTCKLCDLNFRKKIALENHERKVHDSTSRIPCTLCTSTFSRIDALKLHVATLHLQTPPEHACATCGKSYRWLTGLNYHKKHAHGPSSARPDGVHPLHTENYTCHSCMVTYTFKRDLKNHVNQVHNGVNRVPCTVCNASFTTVYGLKMHTEALHSATPPKYTCASCGKSYRWLSGYHSHLRVAHGPKVERWRNLVRSLRCVCDYCETVCDSKKELIRHMACHLLRAEFACAVCGHVFGTTRDLDVHAGVEHGEWRAGRGDSSPASRDPPLAGADADAASADSVGRIKCYKCDETFAKGKLFRRHLAEEHELITICR